MFQNSTKSQWSIGLLAMLYMAGAGAVDISPIPLYQGLQVKPNIMMIIDDSGSMDSEVLFPNNDGALWWNTTDTSFVGKNANDAAAEGVLNYNNAGAANATWKKYVYLFPNGTETGNRFYSDSTHDHYAIPPIAPYAFARSFDYNGMYYNTNETYTPWISNGGYTFGNASTTAAPSDPTRGTGKLNLTEDIENANNNRVFRMHTGMVIPEDTYYRDTDNVWKSAASDITLPELRNVPIRYYPATFYSKVSTGDYSVKNASGTTIDGSCATPVASHYLDFMRRPGGFTSAAADALSPDGYCLKRYEIKTGNTFPSGRTYADEMQNFANWFSYYRKRHIALRGGAGKAFDGLSFLRAGGFRINDRHLKGMWDFDTQGSELYKFLYEAVGNGGTPNREALDYAGQQYNTNTGVITHSCQQNFALLFTDGFSNQWTGSGVANADGAEGSPYADSYSNTMADIGMYYYNTILRSALNANNVPVPPACKIASPPAWLDCNEDLHMVTFGITLGAQGNLFGVTHDEVQDAYVSPAPVWASPTIDRNPVQVDDLYHAAVNSRGEMLNAKTATELQAALRTALESILGRGPSSAAALASNSTRLDTNSAVYQARFNSEDWSGQLVAFAINADGSLGSELWNTNSSGKIPAHGSRKIYSFIGTDKVEFKWSELSSPQRTALGALSITENVLNWIRGDQSKEEPSGTLRKRSRLLGDIINSDPVFVGAPIDFGYQALTGYGEFLSAKKDRTKMLYVGANDGMLHAFKADDGTEKFAYIPKAVLPKLVNLTRPAYDHEYFVDGSFYVGDAYIDTGDGVKWRTILIGTTGAGARSVFALDVTNPDSFDETKVLWEYTYQDNSKLGYTIGRPTIGRMPDGTWVVALGNGYDNGSGECSSLFVIKLADGAAYPDSPISTDVCGSNGLATPVLLPTADRLSLVAAYAGDLSGNLWKFDLTDMTVAFEGDPLFRARNDADEVQPITAMPAIGKHPNGGYIIIFGTGQYFLKGDHRASGPVQSLYGIWDESVLDGSAWDEGSIVSPTDRTPAIDYPLQEQTIIGTTTASGNNWRVVSKNPIDWTDQRGWYLDLPTAGERITDKVILNASRAIFATRIPLESVDPCIPATGTGWIMAVDMETGGRPDEIVFDTNGDREFDDSDKVTVDGQQVNSSGFQSKVGMPRLPTLMSSDGITDLITSGTDGLKSTGDPDSTCIGVDGKPCKPGGIDDPSGPFGRQSWRQLR